MPKVPPINAIIVEQWFNGLYTAITVLTIWTINRNRDATKANKITWAALVLLMYTSATVHCSMNWNHFANAIAANENPGMGPGFAFSLAHVSAVIEISGSSLLALNIFIADWLFIWRCWMVWQRRWIFVVIPIASTITGIVMAALALHLEDLLLHNTDLSVDVIQTESQKFMSFSNVFFSLSIGTSLTTTLLITLRIALVQRRLRKAGLKITSYSALIEILVESAAMYSVTLLLFVILQSTKNEALFYPQNIHAQVAGLAPTLIILRVAAGLSRPETEYPSRNSVADSSQTKFGPEATRSAIRFGNDSNTESEA
ncbi:hypothetical protein BDN70DRAFT_538302 [Pholiota conissans]|uniref:Uncharacterized protein n=1 Tax=Pholiota conissans TaxID=109636 RepID=A0A9P5ZGY3_9AGAR|nr:hypothetical protein BDN70DRAFT_538302 [Pholiota conissans]